MIEYEYVSLTHLGKLFGVNAQQVGKWLIELELRCRSPDDKKWVPSCIAYDDGFVHVRSIDSDHHFWTWHREKSVKALEDAGYKRIDDPSPVRKLIGPFSLQETGNDSYAIANGDGTVFVWIKGDTAAKSMVKMMNLANKHEVFGPSRSTAKLGQPDEQ